MAPVLENCRRIQREAGCSVGLVHHFNKRDDGSVTKRMRGTSAFGGFAEWVIGVDVPGMVDAEMGDKQKHQEKGRRVTFEKVKADRETEPINFVIDSTLKHDGVVKMLLTGDAKLTPLEQDNKRKQGKQPARDAKADAAGKEYQYQ